MDNSTLALHTLECSPPSFFGSSLVVWTAMCIVAISCLFKWWKNHPLYGKNPGAKAYPFIGNLVQFVWNLTRIYDHEIDLMRSKKILTIRNSLTYFRTTFMTANPVNVEHILKTNFANYPKGEYIRNIFHDLLGDGILNADGHIWKFQRKIASNEFSMRSLRNFMIDSTHEEIENKLMPILLRASDDHEQLLDIQDILKRFNFDNICTMTVGVNPGSLDISLPNPEFEQAFDEAGACIAYRFADVFWTLWKAMNIGYERRLRDSVTQVRNFIMPVIKQRRKEMTESGNKIHRLDLLSRFIDYDTGDSTKLCDQFLCDMLVNFFQAGRDTIATALTWFFLEITSHPEIEQNILAEISTTRKASSEPGNLLSFDDLKNMHYLQATLFESMRLHPPVPVDLKVADNDDLWPDGTVIRKGETVGYSPYIMGRMEALWGPDVMEYKPERWLKDGVFVPENYYKYPVFQAGPRVCLGKDMAVMTMKLVAATMLERFTFSVPKGYQSLYRVSVTLTMSGGLPVRVQRRS